MGAPSARVWRWWGRLQRRRVAGRGQRRCALERAGSGAAPEEQRTVTYTNGYEYYFETRPPPFRCRIPNRFSECERRLRQALSLHCAGRRREAEGQLFRLAQQEARPVVRRLGLEDDEADLVAARWLEVHLRGFLARGGGPDAEARNVLTAHLRRALRCRGIDLWRAEYARNNRLAQYYFARFGRVLRRSSRLVERAGFVVLRERPRQPPGIVERVRPEFIVPRPEQPQLRRERLRSTRGAELLYEPWMEACLSEAGGKLKRRTLAELLAQAHGELRRLPGRRDDAGDPEWGHAPSPDAFLAEDDSAD